MKKMTAFAAVLSALLLTACSPESNQNQVFGGQPMNQVVTVSQAKSLADDSFVTLEGRITGKARFEDEEYTFEDSTGSITVEIDNEIWQGQTVTPNDRVRIFGKLDKEVLSSKIDVKMLEKLQ